MTLRPDMTPDGYCTCESPVQGQRSPDCGMASHRKQSREARMERLQIEFEKAHSERANCARCGWNAVVDRVGDCWICDAECRGILNKHQASSFRSLRAMEVMKETRDNPSNNPSQWQSPVTVPQTPIHPPLTTLPLPDPNPSENVQNDSETLRQILAELRKMTALLEGSLSHPTSTTEM